MTFQCPGCWNESSLVITARIELPPDIEWDEIALQLIRCRSCDFSGLAVYTESRRGALDRESVHHTGYQAPAADVGRLAELIGRCPRPEDRRCACPTHLQLAHRGESGKWKRPDLTAVNPPFRMRLGGSSSLKM